jgi:interleukin-1 receptor-associated kinase 1
VVDAGVKENDCSSLPNFSLAFDSLGKSRRAYTIFTLTFTGFDYIADDDYPYTWFQFKKTGWEWSPTYKPLPLSQMMIFINCANPVDSPLYVGTGTCLNGEKSYVNVGGMKASDLMELCSLERMTLLPAKDYKNMSYKEIHSQLAYGFELSWHKSKCGSCASICYIDDSNQTKCAGGQY